MKTIILIFLFFLNSLIVIGQEIIPLYQGKIPNSIEGPDMEIQKKVSIGIAVSKVSRPTLQLFAAPENKINGTSVIICPGGAYSALMYDYEGINIAKEFNALGVTAFVLKYRLPDSTTMVDKSMGPIEDLQQAIKIVREHAGEWKIDSGKIGVIGFSAGGNLAATAGTHFDESTIENKNETNLRPDFLILVYPVISMTDNLTHKGSKNNLLGAHPSKRKINYFSNERHVTKETPPTLLIQAEDDQAVSVLNSLQFYEELLKNSVPAEMHIYYSGNHGFLKNKSVQDHWFENVESWMRRRQLIN